MYLYMDCSERNHAYTRVVERTIMYLCWFQEGKSRIHGLQWAQLHMYAGCSKVNHVQIVLVRIMSIQVDK